MIYSGDSSIADAKFGSRQLAKIYRGSDLLWEKDEWVSYSRPSFPANSSSNSKYGFSLSSSGMYKATDKEFYIFDDKSTDVCQLTARNYGGTVGYGGCLTIKFPVEWDAVQITSITISSAQYYGNYNIVYSSNRSVSNNYSFENLEGTLYDNKTMGSTVNTTHNNVPNNRAALMKIQVTRSSSSILHVDPGKLSFAFKIKKSNLIRWASNYGVTLPSGIV